MLFDCFLDSMANPSDTHHQEEGNHASPSSLNGASNPTNSGPEISATNLKHNPGISTGWTLEDQAILEGLPAELSVIRSPKIAVQLQNKAACNVAMRCRWMAKKEYSKRRKEKLARKNKDKKFHFWLATRWSGITSRDVNC
ncbi:uncharacterized protein LOC125370970 [Ricinus communis]|uniref:uncharacterized protein LOC125370970 n=1 Tax=Ricinus communis TaxID=3988 RepID=UPI00201B2FA6|nr:uncharacterized protein LOC125370970 [Ricinus communis]